MAIFGVGFEVKIAQSVALTAPHQGPSAYMVATDPLKWLHLGIWIFKIVHEKLLRHLIISIAFALNGGVGAVFLGLPSTVFQFPWVFFGSHVILHMFHIASSFDEDGLEATFSQFFCRPASGDA